MSFKEVQLHLAAQSNTIRTFVVDLSILATGKCGKYLRELATARLREPFVNILFQHRPGCLLDILRRHGCSSSNFFRCFVVETVP